MNSYEKRQQCIRQKMTENSIDCFLITTVSDFFYASGIMIRDLKPGQDICLLLTMESVCIIVPENCRKSLDCITFSAEHIFYETKDDYLIYMQKTLLKRGHTFAVLGSTSESGTDWMAIWKSAVPNSAWISGFPYLQELRTTKTQEEQRLISTAQTMTETALMIALRAGVCGKTEKELSALLMKTRLELGFDQVGCGIVSSGPNTSQIHSKPTDRKIKKGDLVMIDIGGDWKGYHADMTRTFHVGIPSEEVKEIYSIVLEAHHKAVSSVRPGINCSELDQVARKVIQSAGYGKYFSHGLGHGIGIQVHEAPKIAPGSRELLDCGMVFSIEPGIYLPEKFGIRIEDLFLIEKNTVVRSLNQMSKSLTVIE